MARQKKYKTASALDRKVNAYFRSISRTITVMERVETGQYTEKGKPIYEIRKVLNDDEEEIRVIQFLVPPSISGLCLYLGISRQTWANYASQEEFLDTTMRARARIEAYLEGELVSREKNTAGIQFNLEHNHGWKRRLEVSQGGVEQYLAELEAKDGVSASGAGDEF